MLIDKTQVLNRLQNSTCSRKSNSFGQSIKNPFMAQYKIFEERLRNPRIKSTSMIMRKRKNDQNMDKQNFNQQIRRFEEEQCLKEAKKLINNQEDRFSVFPHNTIDYDTKNENQKQSQFLLKFRQKLHDLKLKLITSQLNNQGKTFSTMNFSHISRHPRTQVTTSIGSQRVNTHDFKPHTAAQLFSKQRNRLFQRQSHSTNFAQRKSKFPITFINYKRNKSFVDRFTKEKK